MLVELLVFYFDKQLDFFSNVFNMLVCNFYKKYGVELIVDVYEEGIMYGEVLLMIIKYCLCYSFNFCFKEVKDWKFKGVKVELMMLINGNEKLKFCFDCKVCEMYVVGKMKLGMKIILYSSQVNKVVK